MGLDLGYGRIYKTVYTTMFNLQTGPISYLISMEACCMTLNQRSTKDGNRIRSQKATQKHREAQARLLVRQTTVCRPAGEKYLRPMRKRRGSLAQDWSGGRRVQAPGRRLHIS